MTDPKIWNWLSWASVSGGRSTGRFADTWKWTLLLGACALCACGAESPLEDSPNLGSLQQAAEETPIGGDEPGGDGPVYDPTACLTQAAPIIDRRRTTPTVDPLTCFDLTPTVALVKVSDLPSSIRSRLPAKSAAGKGLLFGGGPIFSEIPRRAARRRARKAWRRFTRRFFGLTSSPADDSMLLYVPPMDENGRRTVTLAGDPSCDPDPCPSNVQCGDPTEEKCPALGVNVT